MSRQGTTNVTVSYAGAFTGGTISVYAADCSGSGLSRDLVVTKLAIPAKPSAITGTTAVCPNATYQYQTTAVNNATSYTWTVPATATIQSGQGSTVITVNYPGTFTSGVISVYASNCSGNGIIQSKSITKTTTGCISAKTNETEDADLAQAAPEEEQQNDDFNV